MFLSGFHLHSRNQFRDYQSKCEKLNAYEATIYATLDSIQQMSRHKKEEYSKSIHNKYLKEHFLLAFRSNERKEAIRYGKEMQKWQCIVKRIMDKISDCKQCHNLLVIKEDKATMRNIQAVSDSYLCSNCGACYAICPKEAIAFQWSGLGRKYAVINEICIECGLCQKVCPSIDILEFA